MDEKKKFLKCFEEIGSLSEINGKTKFGNFDARVCEDNLDYHTLCIKDGKISENEQNKDKIKKLVFILESPHKSEFSKEGKPSPILGKTGNNFKKSLKAFLIVAMNQLKITLDGCYRIIIFNSIQYQTSLGENPTLYRTLLFKYIWNSFGKENFETRLKGLELSPDDVVFNCCTKGLISKIHAKKTFDDLRKKITEKKYKKSLFFLVEKHNNSSENLDKTLKELVSDKLEDMEINNYEASHPIRWNPFFDSND